MNKFLIFFLIFITSCTTNKVVSNHGIHLITEKSQKLVVNKSNKSDIMKFLGPPSSKSTFDDNVWIYIERRKESRSLFALGKKKLKKNNVLVVKIDENGILKKKDLYDLNNYSDIKFSENITSQGYQKNSYGKYLASLI